MASAHTGGAAHANQGGAATALGSSVQTTGGAESSSTSQAHGNAQGGSDSGSGGSAQPIPTGSSLASGGQAPSGGSSSSSSDAQSGGQTQASLSSVSLASGGSSASGGTTSGATAGGSAATGGTTSVGGAAQAGAGGNSEVLESICADEEGGAIPYDYSMGLVSEYSFELSMSCEVGGYLMPLVLADPVELSQVNAFALEATDWYRAEILKCADTSSATGPDSYGLLPSSQSSELSAADVDASIALLLMVIDRHDTQPDAVSVTKKDKIKNRLKSVKARAVHSSTVGLTKTLTEPDCVPVVPTGG